MKKEKVFITATHYQRPSKDKSKPGQWEVTEKVEFITQLRNKHIQMATVAVDYINEEVIIGRSKGVQFDAFIEYISERYPEQMKILKEAYKPDPIEEIKEAEVVEVIVDENNEVKVLDETLK